MLSALKVLKVNGKLGELSRPVEVSEQLKFYGKDIYRRFIETFFKKFSVVIFFYVFILLE